MNKLLCIGFFFFGFGVGVLATKIHYKTKYEEEIQKALNMVNEEANKVLNEAVNTVNDFAKDNTAETEYIPYKKVSSSLTEEKPDIMNFYKERVESQGYVDYSTQDEGNQQIEKRFHEEPYVISPEAIGEMDGYSVISLTLFSDGVLADDDFEPMEQDEIADCIGEDYQDHFGDFEDDAVHIRNDIHRTDYEILRDLRPYDEVAKLKPRKVRLNE